jgi:hypothetical protein
MVANYKPEENCGIRRGRSYKEDLAGEERRRFMWTVQRA